MADVVVVIGETWLAIADLAPACAVVLLAIERQSRGNSHRHRFTHGAWVELGVHIKGEGDGLVTVFAFEARDAIVFLSVDRVDREGVFEQDWVGHFDVLLQHGGSLSAEKESMRFAIERTARFRRLKGVRRANWGWDAGG